MQTKKDAQIHTHTHTDPYRDSHTQTPHTHRRTLTDTHPHPDTHWYVHSCSFPLSAERYAHEEILRHTHKDTQMQSQIDRGRAMQTKRL